MENFKLLIITSLFSGLLSGCGMKGPLYQTGATKEAAPVTEAGNKALTELQPAKEQVIGDIQNKLQTDATNESQSDSIEINKQEEDALSSGKEQAEKTAADKQNNLFTEPSLLLAINPSHFTLQLMAMESKDSLQQFIIKHNLPKKEVYLYQTTADNKPRYIVIFGEYASRESAEMASKKLPGTFANMQTWIKSYQLVHQNLLVNKQ